MAKPSRLQVEIDSVERDMNVLAQVQSYIKSEKTPGDIQGEIDVLERVRARLCSCLPMPVSAGAPVVKRSRKKGMPKKDGEA